MAFPQPFSSPLQQVAQQPAPTPVAAPTQQPVYGAEQWVNGIVGGTPIEGGITESWQLNGGLERFNQQQAAYQKEQAYEAANPAPQLVLKQDADGNWYNENGAANQAWVKAQNEALHLQSPEAPSTNFWGNNPEPAQTPQPAAAAPLPYPNPIELWQVRANDAAKSGQPSQQPTQQAQNDFWATANPPMNVAGPEVDTSIGSMYDRGIQQLGLQQDAQGNWSNPNSAAPASSNLNQGAVDQWLAAHPNGPSTDAEYAEFNALNGVAPAAAPIAPEPATQPVDPNAAPKLQLRQDANGNWYNANGAATAAYNSAQTEAASKVAQEQYLKDAAAWQEGVKNGTVDPWAGRERVSWDEFSKTANWSGTTAAQRASVGASQPWEDALQSANHILGNLTDLSSVASHQIGSNGMYGYTGSAGRWAANTQNNQNKALASSMAIKGLLGALGTGSVASVDDVASLLDMSGLLSRSFGSGAYDQDAWYNQISQALGGYDYAGTMANAKSYTPDSGQSYLKDVATYLASPNRKLDQGALTQLATNVGDYWKRLNASDIALTNFYASSGL